MNEKTNGKQNGNTKENNKERIEIVVTKHLKEKKRKYKGNRRER